MTLQEEQLNLERRRVRAAIEKTNGNISQAADTLGVTRDWLKGRLAHLTDLAELATQLRIKANGRANGRPRSVKLPSEKELRLAWAKHGTLDACAAALDVPRTTLWRALSAMRLGVSRGRMGE